MNTTTIALDETTSAEIRDNGIVIISSRRIYDKEEHYVVLGTHDIAKIVKSIRQTKMQVWLDKLLAAGNDTDI